MLVSLPPCASRASTALLCAARQRPPGPSRTTGLDGRARSGLICGSAAHDAASDEPRAAPRTATGHRRGNASSHPRMGTVRGEYARSLPARGAGLKTELGSARTGAESEGAARLRASVRARLLRGSLPVALDRSASRGDAGSPLRGCARDRRSCRGRSSRSHSAAGASGAASVPSRRRRAARCRRSARRMAVRDLAQRLVHAGRGLRPCAPSARAGCTAGRACPRGSRPRRSGVDADGTTREGARFGLRVRNCGSSTFRPATALQRNLDRDGGATVHAGAVSPDLSAMRLDHCPRNSKSESQPAVLARDPLARLVERVENRRQLVGSNADPGVFDGQAEAVAFVRRADPRSSPSGGVNFAALFRTFHTTC